VVQSGPDSAAGVRQGDILAGKYRVERVLGVGGMGVVVAAHHIQLDEKVALKFLLPEALGNPEAVARFAREARAAVKIKSEHVARVSDVGTLPNGSPYMVMEYLEGGDLAAWIKQRGALPIEQAVEFVLQACVAVADAHALGIVHRDLKPANLFCIRRSDGQLTIKVLDFGISKMNDVSGVAAGSVTRTSALMGSPLYMSPEQMRSSKDVDSLTDIWALGIILFELITARPAFLAESVTELAIKVASEPTPAIQSLRADVPAGLAAIVARCLEKDRRRRFANVAELAIALLPFAPKRARASVERISGIIQGAGLSVSGGVMEQVSQTAMAPSYGTQVFDGTLPPVGRTTVGSPRRKAAVGMGIAGGVVLVALVGGMFLLKRAKTASEEPQAAAQTAASPASPPPAQAPSVAAVLAAEPVAAAPAAAAPPVQTATAAPSALAPAPEPAVTTSKKKSQNVPAPAPPPVAHPVAPAPAPPAPAPAASPAAKCDPPYYFDANGNRMFKKECL
jgi:eukaryotic-like serine/threonine-protein kinase